MKRRTWMAMLVAVGLLAAACGGNNAGSEDTGSPSASSSPSMADTGTGTEGMGDHADWPDKLVLGLVPSREAQALVESAQPLADALSSDLGIDVEATVPTDYTALVEAMRTGQADIGAFGPLSVVRAIDRAGAEFIAQSIRFGSDTYHTQWFTHVDNADTYCTDDIVTDEDGFKFCNGTMEADTGPVALDSLKNVTADTTISFVEQTSTSGFLIPALELINAGLPYDEFSPNSVYAGGHDASVIAVSSGDAEVGVSFDDARTAAMETNPEVVDNIVVFAYSAEIPNDGFVVRGDLPDDLKQAITDSLLNYAQTDAGKETLNAIYEIDGLQPANPSDLDVVREADQKLGELITE